MKKLAGIKQQMAFLSYEGTKEKGSVLWTEKNYKDFEIDLEFRFVDGTIDSGIHLRNSDQIQIGISGSLKRT